MADANRADALAAVKVAADQVEVRRARAKIWAGIFGGTPEPTTVGRFVIHERLGAGGMGIVYAADDPQLERRVALKVVRSDASLDGEGSARLVAEAKAMAKLSHPNVITVYEAGTVDDQVFIAMELVEGYTLRSWLDEAPRTPDEVLRLLLAAGEGLAAAHAVGLVHRDFKPENVLVSRDGKVFVTDFGLARTFDAGEESGVRVRAAGGTATTRLAGTPAYMAPEQLRRGTVDARCDQFAWGVTAFEALAGERPFGPEVLQRFAVEPGFEPAPASVPMSVSLSRRARLGIERALSIDPSLRFESLGALLSELRPRRRPWLPLATGGALAAIGGGVALAASSDPCPPQPAALASIWDDGVRAQAQTAFGATSMPYADAAWSAVEAQADRYATAWIELQQRACEAESSVMQACLGRRLKQFSATTALWVEADVGIVERAVGMSLALPAVADCLDPERAAEVGADDGGDSTSVRALDEAAAAFGAGRFEEAQAQVDAGLSEVEAGDATWFELQTLAGRVALARGDGELASAAFERVLAAADGTSARPAVADASIGLVEAQGMVGSDFEADLALARAAEIAVGSAGNPPLARAALEAATARVLIRAGKFDEGLARVERAREVLEGLGERARTELGDVLHVTAALLYEKGRVDEATSFAERAVDVRTEVLGEAHPDVAASMAIVGTLRLAKGDAAGARAVFDDVLQRQRASIGSEHPNYGRALLALGSAQKVLGELEPARATFAEAVTVLEATLEASDPRIMAARLNLAFVEHDLGNLEAAGAAYAATLPLQRAALGERHPMVAITLANYGRLQLEVGGLDEARTLLEEALSIRSEVLGPTHERTLLAMVALAEVEIAANELDAAAARSTPALAQFEATLGAEHPRVAEALIVQGKVALRRGDAAEATASFERATSIRAKNDPDPLALNAARVLWAQALDAAGDTAQARITAATVDVEQLGGSELRGWCDSDCAARVVSLRGGAEDPAASAP